MFFVQRVQLKYKSSFLFVGYSETPLLRELLLLLFFQNAFMGKRTFRNREPAASTPYLRLLHV